MMDPFASLPRRVGRILFCAAAGVATAMAPAHAQLLPSLPGAVDRTLGQVGQMGQALAPVGRTVADARALARERLSRARDLARRYPDRIALDRDGNAVRAGEVVVVDADDAVVAAATALGFRLVERSDLDGLGIGYARFVAPAGLAIDAAVARLRAVAGSREVSTDPLHVRSGGAGGLVRAAPFAAATPAPGAEGRRIGIVDGGVSRATPGLADQRSFANGAPSAQDHATQIASLLTGGGGVRASAPGAALYVADVYGTDPAGGDAVAIARALAWLTQAKVPLVVVSLVGPANPLLARVVAAARQRGTLVVAAVGNDGPAAPPAYPASYPQAIAVTGVDARGRPLIEAGRALKIDYAAPGADLRARGADGRTRTVRGTSFAAPFVAARLSAHLAGGDLQSAIAAVDREAKAGSRAMGRGLVCGDCATRP